MSWQWVVVFVIEALALGFLVWKIWPGSKPPKRLEKPDVKASDLTKRRRSNGGGCH